MKAPGGMMGMGLPMTGPRALRPAGAGVGRRDSAPGPPPSPTHPPPSPRFKFDTAPRKKPWEQQQHQNSIPSSWQQQKQHQNSTPPWQQQQQQNSSPSWQQQNNHGIYVLTVGMLAWDCCVDLTSDLVTAACGNRFSFR